MKGRTFEEKPFTYVAVHNLLGRLISARSVSPIVADILRERHQGRMRIRGPRPLHGVRLHPAAMGAGPARPVLVVRAGPA